jgi:hypothetical protein
MSILTVVNYPAASTTAVALAQTFTAAQSLLLVAQVNNLNSYTFDSVQRQLTLTSASNVSNVNFVITGIDIYGNPASETLAGPNANTVTSTNYYFSISSIVPSANATNPAFTVSVGMSNAGQSCWIQLDTERKYFQASIQVAVTGTVDYSVVQTLDALRTYNNFTGQYVVNTSPTTFPLDAALTGASTKQIYYLPSPTNALQFTLDNTSSGSITFTLVQQGE